MADSSESRTEEATSQSLSGPWIQTYTGKAFNIARPGVEQIEFLDIVHSLSNLCRFNGHCKEFYSVAEHSVHVTRHLEAIGEDKEVCLSGLFHDAAEAYISDIPTPVKQLFQQVEFLEKTISSVIAVKFGLLYPTPEVVEQADLSVLWAEKEQALVHDMVWNQTLKVTPADIKIEFLSPKEARKMFIHIACKYLPSGSTYY